MADCQNLLIETEVEAKQRREEAAEVNAELRSLQERKTNIPRQSLDLRALLCPTCGNALPGTHRRVPPALAAH